MTLLISAAVLILGLALLVTASGLLVKSSVKLAYLLKLSTLFIGLIFVAFGTSLPEAAVSIAAVIKGYKGIALGNVVGSNIANIGLVLGLCGLVRPLKVDSSLFKREIPIMLASVLALYLFARDGLISRFEGGLFLFAFVLFCISSLRGSRSHQADEDFALSGFLAKTRSKLLVLLVFSASVFFLVLGANLMVNSGVKIAEHFSVSPWIIAITVFAVGTSLPELAASLAASAKKISSLSIGNVIGSNIFNVLLVLGIASLIRPIEVEAAVLRFELPLLIAFSLVAAIFMGIKNTISRFEAGMLLLFYCIFIVFLFLK
ncbi:calcium/sodium antiporter [Candidatus Omnitrophota bacterium]